MGYVDTLPKSNCRFTAVALILAKRKIAIRWGSRQKPTIKGWLKSMSYCNIMSELHAELQPPTCRPKDVWQPLRENLRQQEEGDTRPSQGRQLLE